LEERIGKINWGEVGNTPLPVNCPCENIPQQIDPNRKPIPKITLKVPTNPNEPSNVVNLSKKSPEGPKKSKKRKAAKASKGQKETKETPKEPKAA